VELNLLTFRYVAFGSATRGVAWNDPLTPLSNVDRGILLRIASHVINSLLVPSVACWILAVQLSI